MEAVRGSERLTCGLQYVFLEFRWKLCASCLTANRLHAYNSDLAIATMQSTFVLGVVYSVLYEVPLVQCGRIGYVYFLH